MKRSRMDFEDEQSSNVQQIPQSSSGSNVHGTQASSSQSGGRLNRFFCPVIDCPYADVTKARGWATLQGIKSHLREHYAGRFRGAVPQAFLDEHNLCSCSICGKIISSTRFNGACPSCRPSQRAEVNSSSANASASFALPSLEIICSTRVRLLKYVPRSARAVWGQALAQTAAGAVFHNSVQAWSELAMLPKCVLYAPPRQGKSNKSDTAAFTKTRCERWLAGERVELWLDGPGSNKKHQNTKASRSKTNNSVEGR